MLTERTTLTQFLIEERRRHPTSSGELNALIHDVALACKAISKRIASGALTGLIGKAGAVNVQGEQQQKLDVVANDIFLAATEWGGHLAGMVSEELDEPYPIPHGYPLGKYLLAFDPLDGSSNIDVNLSVGSIFSILRAPEPGAAAQLEDFLQPGTEQVAAQGLFKVVVAAWCRVDTPWVRYKPGGHGGYRDRGGCLTSTADRSESCRARTRIFSHPGR